MAARLDADLLAALQRPGAQPFVAAELVTLAGTYYIALAPAGLCDLAQRYAGAVKSWGEPFREAVDLSGLSLSGAATRTLSIIESDDPADPAYRWWSTACAKGYRMAGATITFLFGEKSVARAKWCNLWAGTLQSGWDNPAPREYTLTFAHTAARALESEIKRELNENNRRTIDPTKSGSLVPLAFGHFDSYCAAAKGVVPAIRDTTTSTYSYTTAWWHAKSLTRVYSAAALKATPADYSVSYPETDGVVDTVITFVLDQGTNAITWEGDGAEATGDGTGALVDSEADILELFLHNFVFNRRRSQSLWYTRATAPVLAVDGAAFDAADTFLGSRANGTTRRGSWLITSAVTGLAQCNQWSEETGIPLYWTWAGQLAPYVDDPHTTAYASTVILASECDAPILYPMRGKDVCDQAAVALGIAETGLEQTVVFGDSAGTASRRESISLACGPSSAR